MFELSTILYLQQHLSTPKLLRFSEFINNEFVIGIACLLVIMSIIAIDAYHKKRIRAYVMTEIFFTIDVFITSFFITYLLKFLVNRPRPFMIDTTLSDTHIASTLLPFGSFPSYHSVVALLLVALAWRHHKTIGVCLLPFALLIMYSRVLLGVHFPSDVLAGAIIGIIIVYILGTSYRKIETITRSIVKE